jgi:hypothetical protein
VLWKLGQLVLGLVGPIGVRTSPRGETAATFVATPVEAVNDCMPSRCADLIHSAKKSGFHSKLIVPSAGLSDPATADGNGGAECSCGGRR